MLIYRYPKAIQENKSYIFIIIWTFYPKIGSSNYFGILESVVLIRTIDRCLKNYFKIEKLSHKTKRL